MSLKQVFVLKTFYKKLNNQTNQKCISSCYWETDKYKVFCPEDFPVVEKSSQVK